MRDIVQNYWPANFKITNIIKVKEKYEELLQTEADGRNMVETCIM